MKAKNDILKVNFVHKIHVMNPVQNEIVVWLYSGNYHNSWWRYDDTSSKQLEIIHQDFMKRKKLTQDPDIFGHIPITEDVASEKICDTQDHVFELVEFGTDEQATNDPVDEIKDYTITVAGNVYDIDFEHMKQINAADNTRQRKISRVVFPETLNLNDHEINEYLRTKFNVRGISGISYT
jgi:hypothetical protein